MLFQRSEGKFIFFIRRPSKYYVSISHQQRSGGRRPGEATSRRDTSSYRGGTARLRSWLPGAGVGYLTIGSGFHDWCFNLVGAVGLGVGAPQMLCLNRVSPVIRFPSAYTTRSTKPRGYARPQRTVYPLFH